MTIYYPTTSNFIQKTLNAQLLAGVTASATLNNVTSIQNKAGIMIVDRVDANGVETPNKVEVISFAGTSGSTVTTLVRALGGTTDADHEVGAIVEFGPDIVWAQGLIDTMLAQHNEDGTHKDALVTTLKATASEVTTGTEDAKIVTPKALKDATLTLTSPKIVNSINDTNGNEVIKTPATTSAVNEITVTNAAAGNAVQISATGGDDNIGLQLAGKGTGTVSITSPTFKGTVDGWISVNASWSYASANTITVPSGAASIYNYGDKIKLTQTTVKYFYIIGIADTVLTVTGGSDYTVANAAITNNFYSHAVSPNGFPASFNLTAPTWTTSGTPFTNSPTTSSNKLRIIGGSVFVETLGLTHGTSGGTGIFIATYTTAEVPSLNGQMVGSAWNISGGFGGLSFTDNGGRIIKIAKYDGTAIAGNSQYFQFSIQGSW